MSEDSVEPPSYGQRLHQLATIAPDELALVFAASDRSEQCLTWRQLDDGSTRLAQVLHGQGLSCGGRVAVGLRSSPEHVLATFAGWKLGAMVVPVRWDLPRWERERLLDVLDPTVILEDSDAALLDRAETLEPQLQSFPTPPVGHAICSSGSTGSPKVIVLDRPGVFDPGTITTSAIVESFAPLPRPQVVLVPAPLYHGVGFTGVTARLLTGDRVVLMEHFDADHLLALVEAHRVTGFSATTVMLERLIRMPVIDAGRLVSLQWLQHGAAVIPDWLVERWIDLVGPERFFITYGMTEGIGYCSIRGDAWLGHRGSVGRPWGSTNLRVLDADGREVPPGTVGEIYMKSEGGTAFHYLGDVPPPPQTEDGFLGTGDLGWLDDDGYLYVVDRRSDLIVTGGANVYPAEVEAALSEDPRIADVVVVGVPDPEWGRRVHAIVVPDGPLEPGDVVHIARERLAPYKVPKTVELVPSIPRSEAAKVNRGQLAAERSGSDRAGARLPRSGGDRS